ncbi:MAG: hypothetical protein ACRCX8_15890 [Sarcina sp.]
MRIYLKELDVIKECENPVIYSYIQKNYNMSNFTLYEMLRGIYDVEFSLSVVEGG